MNYPTNVDFLSIYSDFNVTLFFVAFVAQQWLNLVFFKLWCLSKSVRLCCTSARIISILSELIPILDHFVSKNYYLVSMKRDNLTGVKLFSLVVGFIWSAFFTMVQVRRLYSQCVFFSLILERQKTRGRYAVPWKQCDHPLLKFCVW